jgi:hypothetical protein
VADPKMMDIENRFIGIGKTLKELVSYSFTFPWGHGNPMVRKHGISC